MEWTRNCKIIWREKTFLLQHHQVRRFLLDFSKSASLNNTYFASLSNANIQSKISFFTKLIKLQVVQFKTFCYVTPKITTYRISSINSRGYYSFLYVKSAASIWGRPLFKGGYYYKTSKKLREIGPKRDNFCKISTIFIAKFAK